VTSFLDQSGTVPQRLGGLLAKSEHPPSRLLETTFVEKGPGVREVNL